MWFETPGGHDGAGVALRRRGGGGFCVASLTHGIANGLARFPDEMETLERLSLENYAGLLTDI